MRNGGVHDSAHGEAWQDLTLPVDDVMRLAWRLLLGTAVAAFVPFVVLWGLPSLPDLHEVPRWLGEAFVAAVLFVVVYLLSAVVHEGLHAFAMVAFAGVPVRAVRFGLRLSEGVAYVHAARPMTVRAYRVVLVLPGLVQGVLPLLAGLAVGSGWATFYGFVMLVSAAGDVAVLLLLHPLDAGRLVVDHPHDVGCRLVGSAKDEVRSAK